MRYLNETLHGAPNHRENYSPVNQVLVPPIKFRTFYRINREKIEKYRSQCNVKCDDRHPSSNVSKRSNMMDLRCHTPLTTRRIRSEKQIEQTTRSTQTVLLDVVGFRQTQSASHSDGLSASTEPVEETQHSLTSSSDTSVVTDVSDEMQDTQQITPRSTNCRVYFRSIGRQMLSDGSSDDE